MLIRMLAIILAFLLVVFSYQPLTAPSRPRHAQPHSLHNPHLWVSILFMFPPWKDTLPYSAVFSTLHCWLPPSFCT